MRLIGDVHGYYERYKKIIAEVPASIQVGDMGLGFRHIGGYKDGLFTQNPPHAKMVEHNARFIRGNHDNPAECKKNSQWIADGTVSEDVMFIGGAPSIDKMWRLKDYDWWEDEECSLFDLAVYLDKYKELKPRVMITHTCPKEMADAVMVQFRADRIGEVCRTEEVFQEMFAFHQPELWVFGHWHHSVDYKMNGTRFVCLNELEYRDDLL